MSDRTITLPRAKFDRLRDGKHVWWDDNTGREVLLYMQDARPEDVYDGAASVALSPTDLNEIESPAGFSMPIFHRDAQTLVIRMEVQ